MSCLSELISLNWHLLQILWDYFRAALCIHVLELPCVSQFHYILEVMKY